MQIRDVLVTDYVHPLMLRGLSELGYSWTYAPEMLRKEMEASLPNYKGVVINTRCAIDRATIERSKGLKWIARLGSGLEIIDLDAASENDICVFSAPEGNARAVAEHALGMLLALANNLVRADISIREGFWLREEHRGWELEGKTIGIIGYGHNGTAFASLFQNWGVRVLAFDKYRSGFGNQNVEESTLDALLESSDIVSLHIPLTKETEGWIADEFFEKCKPGVVLINTSRGKIVDLRSLLYFLKNGKVKAAALDVLPYEPPSKGDNEFKKIFNELCKMQNVCLSPHVAGWTVESKEKISRYLLQKIQNA